MEQLDTPPRQLGRYASAVVVRMHADERAAMNAAASSAGLSLQNYCRERFGLAIPNRDEQTKGTSE